MKFSKLGVMFAAASIAVGAFADAANVLVSFSTEADYYADGTSVKDGEWYALCWSPRTTFGGLKLDCTPAVEGDEVLILAPLAKGGRCPLVIFQLNSTEAPVGGEYFVYLLDTRDVTGSSASAATKAEDGRNVPANVVNGAVASKRFTASASVGSNVASGTAVTGGASWAAVQPKITAFKVEAATVKITVAGMMSGLTYKVCMGETPDSLTSYAVETPETAEGEAYFRIDPKDARFFSVIAD